MLTKVQVRYLQLLHAIGIRESRTAQHLGTGWAGQSNHRRIEVPNLDLIADYANGERWKWT